jgi:hypothetical protein
MAERVELGDLARDTVTGVEGIVIGESHWLYSCRRLVLQPQGVTAEGKAKDAMNFDEAGVVVVKKGVIARPASVTVALPEPPRPAAPRPGGPAPRGEHIRR